MEERNGEFIVEFEGSAKKTDDLLAAEALLRSASSWGHDISFFDMSKGSLLKIGMMSHAQRGDIQKLIAMLQEMEMVSTVNRDLEEDDS